MVAHMKHMKNTGGIGCIGLGTDFDGIGSIVEMKDCSGMQMLAVERKSRDLQAVRLRPYFIKTC